MACVEREGKGWKKIKGRLQQGKGEEDVSSVVAKCWRWPPVSGRQSSLPPKLLCYVVTSPPTLTWSVRENSCLRGASPEDMHVLNSPVDS